MKGRSRTPPPSADELKALVADLVKALEPLQIWLDALEAACPDVRTENENNHVRIMGNIRIGDLRHARAALARAKQQLDLDRAEVRTDSPDGFRLVQLLCIPLRPATGDSNG